MAAPVFHDGSMQISQQGGNLAGELSHTISVPGDAEVGDTLLLIWPYDRGVVDVNNYVLPHGFEAVMWKEQRGANPQNHPKILVAAKVVKEGDPTEYTFDLINETELINTAILVRVSGASTILFYPRAHGEHPDATYDVPPDVPAISDLPTRDYLWIWVGVGRTSFADNTVGEFTVTSPVGFTQQFSESRGGGSHSHFASAIWTSELLGQTDSSVITATNDDSVALTYGLLIPAPGVDEETDEEKFKNWCPTQAQNVSGTGDDLGDFQEPDQAPHTSQKNLIDVAWDPRTGIMLSHRGNLGEFGEEPATNPSIIRSEDCGKTWTQVADLIADGVIEKYETNVPGSQLTDLFYQPCGIIPGVNPGEWFFFDYYGGYYLSTDNGETWSELRMSSAIQEGIRPRTDTEFEEYNGIIGVIGQFDTRDVPVYHYLDEQVIGYTYATARNDSNEDFYLGVRRSLQPNGGTGFGDWDTSIEHGKIGEGKSGWSVPHGGSAPVVGANGRWIVIVDWSAANGGIGDPITPNVRINTTVNMDPSAWSNPFWTVSEAFTQDYYGGAAFGPDSTTDRQMRNLQNHMRLKFIPNPDHPVGGRWWLMGVTNFLLFSDDNGVTWDKSLMDHQGPEHLMHPILNWRASHPTRGGETPCRVLDIAADPLDTGRLISVGITYDRAGIENRLSVFSCSADGGDTWGPVGQLPLLLSAAGSPGGTVGDDSPIIARHIFPCLQPV